MNANVQRVNLTTANKMMIATEEHGMTRTTSVRIRETPMQRTANKIIRATEEHGMARTTSARIRETPMQKTTNNL